VVPLLDVNWQGLPPYYSLSERDTDVLSLIDEEGLTLFTFDGLKRRLGLHPETLSRILSRLEEEGIVKKPLKATRSHLSNGWHGWGTNGIQGQPLLAV
jgi:DNA-binding IclR family transcriptional regulator